MSINTANEMIKKGVMKIKYTLLILSILLPGLALAARDTNPICSGSDITANVSFGAIAVQRDAAVGEVLATAQTGALNGGSCLGGCSPSPWSPIYPATFSSDGTIATFTSLSTLGSNIYDTNVAGVGIRVTHQQGPSTSNLLPFNTTYSIASTVPVRNLIVELIKTAPTISTGTLQTGMLAQQVYYTDPAKKVTGWTLNLTGNNTVQQVACSVTNTVINVPMGEVNNIDFRGSGSSAGEKAFTIPLNCDAGTKVNVTLEAGSSGSFDASQGIVNLDSSASVAATGIGLQMLFNSTPVVLGEMLSIGTATSQGNFSIPLTARYIQIGSEITPGTANATATFTMTYK